jgi:group I intron endonuclease
MAKTILSLVFIAPYGIFTLEVIMFGYIYKITNTCNGKIYVGKRKGKPENTLNYYGSGLLINRAINKFGKHMFSKDILCSCKSLVEQNELEKYWIAKLKAQDKTIGYNIGGGGEFGDVFTNNPNKEKIRKNMSIAQTGVKHPQWRKDLKSKVQTGKKHKGYSVEGKKNCSEAQKKLYANGYISPSLGRKMTPKQLRQNAENSKIPVTQYSLDGEFIKDWPSAVDASRALGINGICGVVKGTQRQAGGFKWKYTNK